MFDIIIIGAGVIGCAVGRALILKNPKLKIAVFEKEAKPAFHTSGRNSGVLHAGFNQKPGTLKAKFCVEGNARTREYCLKNNIPMKQVGTLVVATQDSEVSVLEELLKRGQANGVPDLKIIDSKRLKELEPNAKGLAALHAPTGAIVDNEAFVRALSRETQEKGVHFFFNHKVTTLEEKDDGYKIFTSHNSVLSTHYSSLIINAAGLYADKIAHKLGVGRDYFIVPFRGEYYKIKTEKSGIINSMIYPVPNLKYPFLGIHWTKKIDGSVAIGPSAVIAFGRESYRLWDVNFEEVLGMANAPFFRMVVKKEFLNLALKQLKNSLYKKAFFKEAKRLVDSIEPEDLKPGSAGNRAQLINRQGELVEDIVVETKGNSIHVLNAVSPGFTSSLPFADFIVSKIS